VRGDENMLFAEYRVCVGFVVEDGIVVFAYPILNFCKTVSIMSRSNRWQAYKDIIRPELARLALETV
jgi:hypothetical protein